MRIYYDLTAIDGKHRIRGAVYDSLLFQTRPPSGASHVEIAELEGNRALCRDLISFVGREDASNVQRFYLAQGTLEVLEVDGWTEREDPIL